MKDGYSLWVLPNFPMEMVASFPQTSKKKHRINVILANILPLQSKRFILFQLDK